MKALLENEESVNEQNTVIMLYWNITLNKIKTLSGIMLHWTSLL